MMRVFITGATGWIGSAVTGELLANGHEVVGLARSDASADALAAAGATALRGSLTDLDVLRAGAAAADAVAHLGFVHDFANFAESGRIERAAVEALAETLVGSGRPLLIASGVAGFRAGVLTELDATTQIGPDSARGGSEALVLSYADRGVRSIAARFAPTVHGAGDRGFTATLAAIARRTGTAAYLGDGAGRWPAVHRLDAAVLVRLALETAEPGTVVHAIAEEGVPTRDIAAALGAALGVPVSSVAQADADAHFGWIGRFWGIDAPASSALTRERFGWTPTRPTLLEDIAAGAYSESVPHND
jgi:nucleoside-diphosphate-sugar epimerase